MTAMKQILLMIAVVMGQSVLAADVVINDPIVRDIVAKLLNKPHGKFAPPLKLNEKDLANFTKLNLRGMARITDAGLKDLAKLKKLEQLMLLDTKITDEGAAELKKALPKLELFLHSYEKD